MPHITYSAGQLPVQRLRSSGSGRSRSSGSTHCQRCGNMHWYCRRECRSSSRCRTVSGSGFPVSIRSIAGHRWPGSRYCCPPARWRLPRSKNRMTLYGTCPHSNTDILTGSSDRRSCHICYIPRNTGGMCPHSNTCTRTGSNAPRLLYIQNSRDCMNPDSRCSPRNCHSPGCQDNRWRVQQ
jgi:hypothetical protein